ncbi:unnamed protein product [Dicrocoelium dendriticum]|nr:unnamed protein product [Dicrocoelium dendriticum]
MLQQEVDVSTTSVDRLQKSSVSINHLLMQQHLALLLHAEHCRRLGKDSSNSCLIRHCCVMQQVLSHIESCFPEENCSFPHCRSSKLILRHFRRCQNRSCDVCGAVQKPVVKIGISPATSNAFTNHCDLPCLGTSNSDSMSDLSPPNGVKHSSSPEGEKSVSFALTVNGEISRGSNRSIFHLSDQQRELAMKKFVNVSLSIFPTANSTAYSDPRMRQFLDHVKRMEKDIFMKSKSVKDYYAALTTCYQSIHSELREKRRLRGARSSEPSSECADLMSSELRSSEKCDLSATNISDGFEGVNVSDASEVKNKPEEQMQSPSTVVQTDSTVKNPCITENFVHEKPEACTDDNSHPLVDTKPSVSISPSPAKDAVESESLSKATDVERIKADMVKHEEVVSSSSTAQTAREPTSRVIWYPNELLRYFIPVVEKISKEKDAEPFLQPVDWESLEIYDYPQIVSNPMDLSTIRKKLENREYKDPWNVVDDFWLMLNNAWLYNKKTSKVYKTCTRLSEIFEAAIDPVMQQLGFCCGREYYYQPPPLTCLTPKFCTIHKDAVYYVYKNDDHLPGLLEQKYTVCERCYNEAGDEIRLDSESSTVVTVQKASMQKCKNDKKEKEPFVFCRKCGRKWHRVCAIHLDEIWPDGFICAQCIKDHGLKRPENRFTARKLSTCKLSIFLEKRVNDFLKKKGVNTGDVIIRVLAAADKTVEVKPGMKARFCESGEMPESFPYRVKAIFAFQEIDGQEVCFFGLHVQEYGSECPYPNTRRVYLAYLDSVYFFRPKQYRTDIYHEILVGYIHYAKLLGFTMAHIWACPPSEGDDYIFHMHPPDQKIPKPKRLQEWYQKMLKKALLERIVVDYKDICQDACESRLVSPTELAYFEGDFWPNTLEELFKEMDEEDARRKREQEALARDDEEEDAKETVQTGDSDNNPGKKKAKKRKLKRNPSLSLTGKRKRLNGNGSADLANEVARRVYEIMEKHKENFFVIRLQPQNMVSSLPPIKDPDPLISSDLMECRGAFLERAREKHLEFSSVRRAKYSTLVMLYELHNENRQPLMYTCNVCSVQLETPWHCKQCVEYDLCSRCYETENHPHPMVQVGLGLDDGSRGQDMDSDSAAVQESGRDKLSRLVKALSHGCSCRDANCRVSACKTMKSNVQHFRVHAAAARNQCPICRSLSFLCYYHSKTCHELKCPVPLCPKLKAKMKQQQKQQRLEQTQMLRRRMATMQRYHNMTPNQPSGPSQPTPHQMSSASDCTPSPASGSMQLSPYPPATSAVTGALSFNPISSPLSRSQASLPSPQQPSFIHHCGSGGQVSHPKPVAANSGVQLSPSITSPQHTASCPYSSTSPYSFGPQPFPSYVDPADASNLDGVAPGAYPYTALSRSQSASTVPCQMGFQASGQLNTRQHSSERPQSTQYGSGPSLPQFTTTGHPQLMRQSPGLSQTTNAPSSPRYQQQQIYPGQTSQLSDNLPYLSHGPASTSRLCPEPEHPPYSRCKQQPLPQAFSQQRQLSQVTLPGNAELQHSISSPQCLYQETCGSPGPHWRPSASHLSSSTLGNCCSGPALRSPHSGNSPCAPNVTVARAASHTLASAPHACVTPPMNSGGIPTEDIHLVRQTYNEMRQRGALAEFSSWINSNPHLIRAWQFLQQSHMYAQQFQYQQQQQQQAMGVGMHGSIIPPQPLNNYSMGQVSSSTFQPSLAVRGGRHPSHLQMPLASSQSLPQGQAQQWASMAPQQTRLRPTIVGAQPSLYYSQSDRLCATYTPGVPQQQTSTSPRYADHPGNSRSSLQVNSSSQISSGNTQPRSGSVMPQVSPHLQQQFSSRCSGNCATLTNVSSIGPLPVPGSTMTSRSGQPLPQYSSAMLSQLLGPGQSTGGGPGAPMSAHFPANPFASSQML